MPDGRKGLRFCAWVDRGWNWNGCWIGGIGRKGGSEQEMKVEELTIKYRKSPRWVLCCIDMYGDYPCEQELKGHQFTGWISDHWNEFCELYHRDRYHHTYKDQRDFDQWLCDKVVGKQKRSQSEAPH